MVWRIERICSNEHTHGIVVVVVVVRERPTADTDEPKLFVVSLFSLLVHSSIYYFWSVFRYT